MDRGAWWAAVHGVAKSRTQLSDFPFTFHFHALEKEMATHSSVLAWRIPGTGELGGLPSMGSHRVGHDCSDLAAAAVPPLRISEILETTVLLLVFVTSAKNSDELSPHEIECFSLYCFKNYWPRQYILKHVTSIACLPSPLTVLVP